jgi:hypothetical protein
LKAIPSPFDEIFSPGLNKSRPVASLTGTESRTRKARVIMNRHQIAARTTGRPSKALEMEAPRLQALYVVEIEWEKLLSF